MRKFQNSRTFHGGRPSSGGGEGIGPQAFFGIVRSYEIKDARRATPGEDAAIVALLGDVMGPNGTVIKAEFDEQGQPLTTVRVVSYPPKEEPAVQAGGRGRLTQPLGPNTIFDLMRGRGQSQPARPGDLVYFENARPGKDGTFRTERCYNAASKEDLENGRALPMQGILASVLPEERRWVPDPSGKGGHFEPTGRQFVLFPDTDNARPVTTQEELLEAISAAVTNEGIPGRAAFVLRAAILASSPEEAQDIAASAETRIADYFIVRAVQEGDSWRAPTPAEVMRKFQEGAERISARKEILESIGRGDVLVEVIPAIAVPRSQYDVPSISPSGYDVAARHYSILAPVPEGEKVYGEVYETEKGRIAPLPNCPGIQPTAALIKISENGNAYVKGVDPTNRYGTPVPLADVRTPHLPEYHLAGIEQQAAKQKELRIAVAQAAKMARAATAEAEPEAPAPAMP